MTGLWDFTQGLRFSHQQTNEIRETYSIPVGKKELYINNANELMLHFTKDDLPFVLRVRAYDEGMAFRYEIPLVGEALSVQYETTDFRFPESFDKLWLQDWVASYEAPYNKTAWGIHHKGRHFGMPSLLYSQQTECWVMINEANVLNTNGSYCISHLKGTDERRLLLDFAPEEHGQPMSSPLPFASPWRLMVVEDSLNGIVNATLNYNLNPPSIIEDTSWIKPVRALWAWWSSDMGAQLYSKPSSMWIMPPPWALRPWCWMPYGTKAGSRNSAIMPTKGTFPPGFGLPCSILTPMKRQATSCPCGKAGALTA
jgi:alpha-glucosidase